MEGCNWCPTVQYYVLISQVGHPDMIEGSVSTNKCGDQHQARGQGMVTGLSNQGASLGTRHLTQQPQDIPRDGPCCWCLRKHLMSSLAIEVLQEELHRKLAFQIIGCYDALCFCDEVHHQTIPKLSAEFGESWWRHPWSWRLPPGASGAAIVAMCCLQSGSCRSTPSVTGRGGLLQTQYKCLNIYWLRRRQHMATRQFSRTCGQNAVIDTG